MEKRKPTLILIFLICLIFSLSAQDSNRLIQVALWADIDAYPGLVSSEKTAADFEKTVSQPESAATSDPVFRQLQFAAQSLRTVAPFIVQGMVYGWKFEYSPSDKARGVAEYFSFEPVAALPQTNPAIQYTKPWIQDNRLNCWVLYERNEYMLSYLQHWQSIDNPTVSGRGEGSLSDGFSGIQAACSEALKLAVREYWRTKLKNKPKEISGIVLLRNNPRIFVQHGRYIADLDFFLKTDRIVEYNQF